MLTPPEGGAHCCGADPRRPSECGVVLSVASFSTSRSTAARQLPGIPPLLRMKPWGVLTCTGPFTKLDRTR